MRTRCYVCRAHETSTCSSSGWVLKPLCWPRLPQTLRIDSLDARDICLASPDGEPLLFCAVSDGIAIGFPSEPIWDTSAVTVDFRELLPDGSIADASETIDNLTRLAHAEAILDRHSARIRGGLRQFNDGAAVWEARSKAFPNLVFGPDVESHLNRLNAGDMGTIVNKLASLDDTAANWRKVEDDVPPWRTKVTNETASVRSDPMLRQSRRFRSSDGSRQFYFWHARYGGSGTYSSPVHAKCVSDRDRVHWVASAPVTILRCRLIDMQGNHYVLRFRSSCLEHSGSVS